MDGFKLDLTDPKILQEASVLDDESCELRCGNEKGHGQLAEDGDEGFECSPCEHPGIEHSPGDLLVGN